MPNALSSTVAQKPKQLTLIVLWRNTAFGCACRTCMHVLALPRFVPICPARSSLGRCTGVDQRRASHFTAGRPGAVHPDVPRHLGLPALPAKNDLPGRPSAESQPHRPAACSRSGNTDMRRTGVSAVVSITVTRGESKSLKVPARLQRVAHPEAQQAGADTHARARLHGRPVCGHPA